MGECMKKALFAIDESIRAVTQLKSPQALEFLEQFAALLESTFASHKKVLVAGNGGSLCDAAHFAEELTGFFRSKRKAFPALVLSEPGHITCVGNDVGFEYIFQRGVEAFGSENDVLVVLSTSGSSPNILLAVDEAKKKKMKIVSFIGKSGGLLKGKADLELHIQGFSTSDRIQEAHMAALHIAIELFESRIGL